MIWLFSFQKARQIMLYLLKLYFEWLDVSPQQFLKKKLIT